MASADTDIHNAILSDALKLAESGNLAAATDALRSALEIDFRGEVAGLVSEFEQVLRTGQGAALAAQTLRLLVEEACGDISRQPSVRERNTHSSERVAVDSPVPGEPRAPSGGRASIAELRDRLSDATSRTGEQASRRDTRSTAPAAVVPEAVDSTPGADDGRWFSEQDYSLSESSPSATFRASASGDLPSADAAGRSGRSSGVSGVSGGEATPFGFADASSSMFDDSGHGASEAHEGRAGEVSSTVPRQPMPDMLARSRHSGETPSPTRESSSGPMTAATRSTGRMMPVGDVSDSGPLPADVLLDRAKKLVARGDLASAMELLDDVLAAEPSNEEAQQLRDHTYGRIGMLRLSALEPLDRVPEVDFGNVSGAQLTPQSMFIVSLADGVLSLRDMVDMSGMPRADAAVVLTDLIDQGVLRFR